jgi:hypothetical protein
VYALEHAARGLSFLDLPLRLERDSSLANELSQTGGPAYAGDLVRWHISKRALKHYFQIIQDRGGAAVREIINHS